MLVYHLLFHTALKIHIKGCLLKKHSHCLWAEIQAKTQIMISREWEALLSRQYLGLRGPEKGWVFQEQSVDQLATLNGKGRQLSSFRLQQADRIRGTGAAIGEKAALLLWILHSAAWSMLLHWILWRKWKKTFWVMRDIRESCLFK